jgi:hypothetical protein
LDVFSFDSDFFFEPNIDANRPDSFFPGCLLDVCGGGEGDGATGGGGVVVIMGGVILISTRDFRSVSTEERCSDRSTLDDSE